MSIKEDLKNAIEEAMREMHPLAVKGDNGRSPEEQAEFETLRTTVTSLRTLVGEIQNREKSGKKPEEWDDAKVVEFLRAEGTKRIENVMTHYAGNDEKIRAELAEATLIQRFLPEEIGVEELDAIVDEEIAKIENPTIRDRGRVIKAVSERVGLTAGRQRVAAVVSAKVG